MWFNRLFVVFLICTFIHYIHSKDNEKHKHGEILFITISSKGDWSYDSFIELNWEFSDFHPDSIALFRNAPRKAEKPMFVLKTKGLSKGNYTTDIPLKKINLPKNWQQDSKLRQEHHGPQCLDLWIAAFKKDKIKHVNCLKIQPTWMKDMRGKIGNTPMDLLFIPGTHDSASYDYNRQKTYNLRAAKKILFTQNADIWHQLVFGIRYFDIRIAAYTDDKNKTIYWINHGPFKMQPLDDYLNTVKLFLKKAPHEVIIIDIHRNPVGFDTIEEYKKLADYLEVSISDLMISRNVHKHGHGPTLNQIWRHKTKRLIVCFSNDDIAKQTTNMWDNLNQNWGDVMSSNNLKTYLKKVNIHPDWLGNTNPFWSAMSELTADATYSVLSLLTSDSSYGDLGEMINKDITHWYRKHWCYTANIVATDFFLGNDIISVALECNLKRTS